jgi:hypothetical protein
MRTRFGAAKLVRSNTVNGPVTAIIDGHLVKMSTVQTMTDAGAAPTVVAGFSSSLGGGNVCRLVAPAVYWRSQLRPTIQRTQLG